ncbi:MAG: hypothetical protein JWM09_297 [Francisellaceae bacterium]|nr:hypothetical protein [Francisellaceae bacterium]
MFKRISAYSSIPVGIWAVSLASLLISISTTMTFSLSPIYLTEVLGISLFSMGLMEGFSEGLSQISKLFSGMIGDYCKKKKPVLLIGFLLAALSKPFFILANGLSLVMLSKVLERLSNGIIASPRDAYVASEALPNKKGLSLGFMMTMKTLGCTIGSWTVAILLKFIVDDYRLLLWLGFIPCMAAIYILYKYLKEPTESAAGVQKDNSQKIKFSIEGFKHLPMIYWGLLIIAVIFMSARISDGFLMLRLKELGASASMCASTIGTFNIISALCCLPIGKLSDRYSRTHILYFAFITLIGSHCCFIFADNLWLGLGGIVLWGMQRGSSQLLFSAIIADIVPKNFLGTAIGFFYLSSGIVALVAGAVAGKLSGISLQSTFIYGAFIATLALLGLIILNKRLKKLTLSTPITVC